MITAEEIQIDKNLLVAWLNEKRPVTILDIRPLKEREEWKIPGSIHADVYEKLKGNDRQALAEVRLDNQHPVVTVCAAGKMSLRAAEQLRQNGFDAWSLEGGMKAWNFAWNTATLLLPGVKIIQVRRSSKGCFSYIVGSKNEAMVIDAALDPHVYLELAKANGWSIKYVTDTHIHADYVSRSRELAKISQAKHLLLDETTVTFSFTPVKNGERIKVGDAILEVMHTPGHTLESTSFRLGDDMVFTGDTLFVDGVGRPDLKADPDEAISRSKLLYASLHRLLKLNPKTFVLPAHLSSAVPFDDQLITETIGNLKGKLDVLNLHEDAFVQYTTSRIPPTPPNYVTIASLNKRGEYEGYSPADLEAGANRCAIA
jgi:glyoxylase-like metal-dependent hydrolase (beta-lactamase superfamily II)/rhodanese-related sulfurtransferase